MQLEDKLPTNEGNIATTVLSQPNHSSAIQRVQRFGISVTPEEIRTWKVFPHDVTEISPITNCDFLNGTHFHFNANSVWVSAMLEIGRVAK